MYHDGIKPHQCTICSLMFGLEDCLQNILHTYILFVYVKQNRFTQVHERKKPTKIVIENLSESNIEPNMYF